MAQNLPLCRFSVLKYNNHLMITITYCKIYPAISRKPHIALSVSDCIKCLGAPTPWRLTTLQGLLTACCKLPQIFGPPLSFAPGFPRLYDLRVSPTYIDLRAEFTTISVSFTYAPDNLVIESLYVKHFAIINTMNY